VTANGPHAWVATDDGTRTHLRLYTAGNTKMTAERVLPGRLAGPHLLAIGGTSVYVVTRAAGGNPVVHQLSATDLKPLATISVPGARLVAYGSNQLYVADPAGVLALRPDLSGQRRLVLGTVTTLTTGDDLVWCDAGGGGLAGLDPQTGDVISVAQVSVDPGELFRADGPAVWEVGDINGAGIVVRSAQPPT
jgi:hypothetical protein